MESKRPIHSRLAASSTPGRRGITGFAIKNHVTVLMGVVLLSIFGASSYFSTPKRQDPGFLIRAARITTIFPGANPARVEQLVTDRIEEVIQEIPELDYIESQSSTGVSIVTVNFQEKYKTMRPMFDKVRRKMNDLKDDGTLPNGVIGPTVNDEFGDVYGLVYALQGDGFSDAELKQIADEVRNDILKLDHVGKVEIHGGQDEVVYVEYNGARLQEIGLTPTSLAGFLATANILQTGGDIRVGQERMALEPSGNFESLDALGKTVIQLPDNGGVICLGDIATISRGYVDPRESMGRYNGKQAVVLAISLKEGGDILKLNRALDKAIPQIESAYPYGIRLTKVFSQPKLVKNAVNRFMLNLGQAVAIVSIIVIVFLGLRTGLTVASLIPTTILVTFVCMSLFDITVNQISLAALIISLGLLVDNAIVMAEAIMVRRENGEDKVSAAVSAGMELGIPLLTSSLTTAAAFLPIFLAEARSAEYTADIFKVVSITLLTSWVLAMTFIPLITIFMMKVNAKPSASGNPNVRYGGVLYKLYRLILFPCLRFRILPLMIAGGLLVTAVWALQFVPKVFIPGRTDPVVKAKFDMPRGTDIAVTEAILKDLEQHMLKQYAVPSKEGGITDILSFIGVGAPRYVLSMTPDPQESHRGAMIIQLENYLMIPDLIHDVQQYAAAGYPDLEVKMQKMENGPPIDYPVEVRISGDDISKLYDIVASVKDKLLATRGVMLVSDDWGPRTKKLAIRVHQDRARRAGISNSDVALSLSTGLSGLQMTDYRENNDIIPVKLRSVSSDRQDLDKLDGLMVYARGSRKSVPLKQVADVELVWENAIISRRDRTRAIVVRTQNFPGVTAMDVSSQIIPWLENAQKSWPPGYTYEMGGEMEASGDAGKAIGAKLPVAGMAILLLLAAQFNSIRKTAIILFTIPLGVIGVTFGLLVAKSIFGLFTILGLVSLSGIIVNNAIVLIDRINIEREENGLSAADAVIEACQQRARPIMLTTATTTGGMLPLWLSHDPMFETMAVSLIFGLMFGTLLTLVIVPVLYSIFFKVKYN